MRRGGGHRPRGGVAASAPPAARSHAGRGGSPRERLGSALHRGDGDRVAKIDAAVRRALVAAVKLQRQRRLRSAGVSRGPEPEAAAEPVAPVGLEPDGHQTALENGPFLAPVGLPVRAQQRALSEDPVAVGHRLPEAVRRVGEQPLRSVRILAPV